MFKALLTVLLAIVLVLTGCNSANSSEKNRVPENAAKNNPAKNIAEVNNSEENDADSGEESYGEIPYKMEVLVENLEVPWAFDMAKDGSIFFTERPGRLRVYREGKLQEQPVFTMIDTHSEGEGGLLGLALDPDFEQSHYIYVYQTYQEKGETKNRVIRLVEKDGSAEIDGVIINQLPGSMNHNGGRIKFGPDQKLYITAGDTYQTELAQQLDSLGGKILRLERDGSIPDNNPFEGSPVYSWGHRNPQGLAWHPQTDELFSSEHGQSAHDEINLVEPGENYGWPMIEGDEESNEMNTPLLHSANETWAPSGATFVTQGPWKGDLLAGSLRGQQILRVSLDTSGEQIKVGEKNELFRGEFGRIRDVFEGTDGTIYFLTNNHDGRGNPAPSDDRIMMLAPEF